MARLSPVLLNTLVELTKAGAAREYVLISSAELASRLGRSQQAASQHFVQLENEGLIERRRTGVRLGVRLTQRGQDEVKEFYSQLKAALEQRQREVLIQGTLFEGFGEGAYYTSLPGYKKQFVELLGFEPFPGTLNLKLASFNVERKRQLRLGEGLVVHGFENGTRTYGGAKCYKARMNGVYPAAVLLIDRTHYDDTVLELISPLNLRMHLGLKNGDEIEVKVLTES
jgi:riboflavin kinase